MRIEPILAAQAKARHTANGGDKRRSEAAGLNSEQPVIRDINATKSATQAAVATGLRMTPRGG
jgi:hypothetical protein